MTPCGPVPAGADEQSRLIAFTGRSSSNRAGQLSVTVPSRRFHRCRRQRREWQRHNDTLEQGRAIAPNRWMPPEKSTDAAPPLVGGPSGTPVAAAPPDIACTVMSMADMWA
jgi:hypothetical protein